MRRRRRSHFVVCEVLSHFVVCEVLRHVIVCEVLRYVVVCEVLSHVVVCEVLSHVVAQPQEVEGGAEEAAQKDTQTVDSTEGRVTISGSVSQL